MRYPVDVYTGKIQAYPEGKPSAIAKIQVDGELMLTDLGLEGARRGNMHKKQEKFDLTPWCIIEVKSGGRSSPRRGVRYVPEGGKERRGEGP